MKKIILKLHFWLAIPFGIVIALLCFSGAVLVFETEIQEWTKPHLYFAKEVKEVPMPLEELMPAVQKQLPDSIVISGVSVPSGTNRNYRVGITGQGRTQYMVDPYTAEIKGKINPYEKGTFFSFVRRLHRWFMFQYNRGEFSWGKMITGSATLVLFFILLTGAVLWKPRSKKMLKRRMSVKVKKGPFRFFYDLHVAGGFYVCLFLVLFCLTGLTWSFGWYRTGFYKLFGAETVQQPANTTGSGRGENAGNHGRGGSGNATGRPGSENAGNEERQGRRGSGGGRPDRGREGERVTTNWVAWNDVLTQLQQENPGYKTISIQAGTATVANNRYGNIRASDRYSFHPYRGIITDSELYKDADRSVKLRGWIYSIHVGAWGGTITKILSFLACIIGGCLPLTGYYMFYKKRVKKKKQPVHTE